MRKEEEGVEMKQRWGERRMKIRDGEEERGGKRICEERRKHGRRQGE